VTQSLVYLHIIAGSVAVIGMIGALVSRKGGLWHRRMGRLYSYAMAAALLLALIVSVLTVNSFLGLIGLFSGYFVYTGWRLAVVKDGRRSHIDRVASLFMMCCAFAMMAYGIYQFVGGESLGVALAVFGIFALLPAWQDYQRNQTWPVGKDRIVLHLSRMGGASIATLTAVFVVNVQTSPAFIAWLLPTMIGTPLIIYWTRRATGTPPGHL
jgi:uncharacterized membrane protein